MPHDSRSRPQPEARRRGGRAVARRDRARVRRILTELRQLAKTLGFEVVHRFTQKRAGLDSAGYFGLGKRQELRDVVEGGADIVLVDHEISPSQAHSLEKEVGCEVMDRTMVILENLSKIGHVLHYTQSTLARNRARA